MFNLFSLNNVQSQQNEIAETYTDTANVYRYGKTTTAAGATRNSKNPEPVYSDIPCRISQKEINSPIQSQSDTQNQISYEIKMFCSPEYDIKAGDKVEVTRDGKVIKTYEAGEPFPYPSHLEILLHRLGRA